MRFEEQAAVILVCSVLRDDLNLCSAEPSILRVVVVRDDFDFLDRILIRRDDRRSPSDAVRCNTIDLIVVFAVPGAVCGDLAAVFNLETALGAAGSANCGSRQVGRSSTRRLCTVTEAPGASWRSWKTSRPKEGSD